MALSIVLLMTSHLGRGTVNLSASKSHPWAFPPAQELSLKLSSLQDRVSRVLQTE
jgi:hypothetical protein